jgi:BAI1-associated protein 3
LKLVGFHQWFSAAVSRWLDIALYKALIRIGKAIALDNFTPVDPLTKHSSSAVDTVAVFYQVTSSTSSARIV